MMIPTIHLNGTAKQDLMDALSDAYFAIGEAQRKLADTAPNGRDYYPQGGEAIYTATEEHRARWQKLEDVRRELDELRNGIDKEER
jgi:hypothetical protein